MKERRCENEGDMTQGHQPPVSGWAELAARDAARCLRRAIAGCRRRRATGPAVWVSEKWTTVRATRERNNCIGFVVSTMR